MLPNLISKLRNSQEAYHKSFIFRDIGFCTKILDILWDQGFIRGYVKLKSNNILIYLLYQEGFPLIKNLCVLSKPTCRIYASGLDIYRLLPVNGIIIVSTTQGIMTAQKAAYLGIGGEILAYFG